MSVSFIGTNNLEMKEFNKEVIPKIQDAIEKRHKIFVSTTDKILLSLLKNRKYVDVTVYCVHKPTKCNKKIKYKELSTESEVIFKLREDANTVFEYTK
jgi:hypothetical protein